MRLFALKDSNDAEGEVLAVLSCYEASREFFLDMPPETDPWTIPFVLSSFASREKWEIGPKWSGRWVDSRLVPQSRQNLGEVLRENGLDSYDRLQLLELTGGRNSQDDCYLEPLRPADAPKWFRELESRRVAEAVALAEFRLLVAFRDGSLLICDGRELAEREPDTVGALSSEAVFTQARPSAGGHGVCWKTVAYASGQALRETGILCGLTWEDLALIAPTILVDSSTAAKTLGCSRQNINALVKRGVLRPAMATGKTTLFLRADIHARQSQA